MENKILKSNAIPKAALLLSLIIIVFYTRKCCLSDYEKFVEDKQQKEQLKITADSLEKEKTKSENIYLKKQVDSLKKVTLQKKETYRETKKKVQEEIKQGVCDTNEVKQIVMDCDNVIYSQDSVIIAQDTLIFNQQKEINQCDTLNKDYRNKLNSLSKENEANKSDLKKEKRKTKILKVIIKSGMVTISAAVIAWETLKMIKP